MEQTIKCSICGEPYVFYSYYAGDQSVCPDCRMKARERTGWFHTTDSTFYFWEDTRSTLDKIKKENYYVCCL